MEDWCGNGGTHCCASIASLTIYDMLKPIDEYLSIESIRLIEKKGGINDFKESSCNKIKAQFWLLAIPELSKKMSQAGSLLKS